MRSLPVLFLAGLLLSGAAVSSAPEPVVRFYVRLTSDSDWTRWKPEGAAFLGRAIDPAPATDDSSGYRTAGVGFLGIFQPIKTRKKVSVLFEVYATDVQRPLKFSLRKGDLGEAKFELFVNRPEGHATPDVTLMNTGKVPGDPENPAPGEIPSDVVERFERMELPDLGFSRHVLAFYYPWYGNPAGASKRWSHWNPHLKSHAARHTPQLGWYDSGDEATVRQHIAWAQQAGVDGFIVSWWGPDSFEDRKMALLLKSADAAHFSISVYLERGSTPEQVTAEIEYLIQHYASSPAFLREEGEPVIFVYGRVLESMDTAEKWRQVRDALTRDHVSVFLVCDTFNLKLASEFDGVHNYNPVLQPVDQVASVYQAVGIGARLAGKLFAATVVPGYDDTRVRTPGNVAERKDGALYRAFWEAALSANPEWILITSFNEWHEGSEIEPSKELRDQYLKLTQESAAEFQSH